MSHFGLHSDYRIVNPDAGDVYFEVDGTAYDAQTDFSDSKNPGVQPTINTGVAKGLYSNRSLLNNIAHSIQVGVHGSQVVGGAQSGAGTLAWGSEVTSVTPSRGTYGNLTLTKTSHGRSVGDIINVLDTKKAIDGVARIISITSDDVFVTDMNVTAAEITSALTGTTTYKLSDGTLKRQQTPTQWIMKRVTDTVRGASNTFLRSGALAPANLRLIHQRETVRTYKVATAIVAGYWNNYSGQWSTVPTQSEDIADESWGLDHAVPNATGTPINRPIPGELVYRTGKPLPTQADYPAKTG